MNQKPREAGVDEAGRGPVLGPIVFGAVALTEEQRRILEKKGVTDSKGVSKKKRIKLYDIIKENSLATATVHYSANKIDILRKKMTMNEIEVQGFIEVIIKLATKVDVIYLDAADVNPKRFEEKIQQHFNPKIIAKHKADKKYVVVGAASILAKVERDRVIKEIERKIGEEIGSGYPGDEKTRKFLKNYYIKHRSFPDFVRTSWVTIENILKEIKEGKKQKKLDEFF